MLYDVVHRVYLVWCGMVRRDVVCGAVWLGLVRRGTVRCGMRFAVWFGLVPYAMQCGGVFVFVRRGTVEYTVCGAVLYGVDRCGAAFGGDHRSVQCVDIIIRTARLGRCELFVR